MKTANLFIGGESVHFNACVGNNGWVNINTYIDGYRSATLIMLQSALCKDTQEKYEIFDSMDTAIYPIFFSARHFIELYIKQKIYAINFFKLKKEIETNLIKTHDIEKLWRLFIDIVNKTCDSRIEKYIGLLEPYINDFAKIDLTGETFRYPYSSDNKKHLTQHSIINLYNFYEKFKELSELCQSFTLYMDYLVDEYKAGTYTNKLNRQDIEIIAQSLPAFSEWRNDYFDDIRNDLKQKFSICSKELSDAINIIKNHFEFRRYIYPDEYQLPLSKDKLIDIVTEKYNKEDVNKFTIEEVACLRTLVELGTAVMGGSYYSENYQELFTIYLEECKNSSFENSDNYTHSINNKQTLYKGLKTIGYLDKEMVEVLERANLVPFIYKNQTPNGA